MRLPAPVVALAPLVAVTGLLMACGADTDELAVGPGRQVYLQQCSTCHGVDRTGIATAPALTESRMVELGEASVRNTTLNGGATMAGFQGVLTDEQLDALVIYLFTGSG
jgi:mono/diheme cytochrome c family protein